MRLLSKIHQDFDLLTTTKYDVSGGIFGAVTLLITTVALVVLIKITRRWLPELGTRIDQVKEEIVTQRVEIQRLQRRLRQALERPEQGETDASTPEELSRGREYYNLNQSRDQSIIDRYTTKANTPRVPAK